MAKEEKGRSKFVYSRHGTKKAFYVRRVPSDVAELLKGKTLEVPLLGVGTVAVKLNRKLPIVRLSLRTSMTATIVTRERAVTAYLDSYFATVRGAANATLTHRQLTALAGELYAAWATEPDLMPATRFRCASLGLPQKAP